ncbi:peroxiredoxin [Natronogracilivirga saccharolytica]|uniref:thioredoxin-dependent peroxiredoxin n=1 Tax=Natronogracilivirga saccharolytica TaxID=2812953 RepID=A0A8J7RSD2_9BACT|nr:peroxiredoxin [Natronogracilivirga saccharolytica]MBP3192884.1 peroxiredoxin [Natronogracilivirga saccharolytica]
MKSDSQNPYFAVSNRLICAVTVAAVLFVWNSSSVQAQVSGLNPGDPAPDFSAVNHEGEKWEASDHFGEILVVFFFPAAMTGGCTDQACSFRDHYAELRELGASVVGISGDRVENLDLFRRANNLNYPLLSDSDGSIAEAFGVPVREGGTFTIEVEGEEKELTREVTTDRWTFIIDEDGNIAYVDSDVDVSVDSEVVIAAIKEMKSG